MLVHALLLGFCWLSVGAALSTVKKSPGFVIRLKPSALNFVGDYAGKNLFPDIIRNSLNAMDQTKNCIATSCSLNNFVVSGYVPPKSDATLSRELGGIVWKKEKARFDISLDFEFNKTDGSESGSVRGTACLQVSEMSLAEVITLTRRSDGQLILSLTKCIVDVRLRVYYIISTWDSHSSQKFKDSLNSRPNISGYLNGRVNETLRTSLCKAAALAVQALPEGVDWVNAKLSSLLGFYLDFSLVREIIVEADHIELAFSGEFRVVGDKIGPSFPPPNLDLPSTDSSMVTFYLSEYFSNTLLDILFKKGWLAINITKDLLPLNYKSLFDTTCDKTLCFGTNFPNIAQKYPDAFVKLSIGATSRPVTNYYSNFESSHLEFYIDIVIPRPDGSEALVAKLSGSLTATKTVFLTGDRARGTVSIQNLTIADNGSPKEFIPYVPRFNFFLKLLTDSILLPFANYLGSLGIPLRLPFGIRLTNADMTFIRGAFRFSTDFVYDPTPMSADDYYIYNLYAKLFTRM